MDTNKTITPILRGAEHHLPKVSIGIPVFNGERFLCQAIDSLLEQDYKNFELFISDNASNDMTQQICLSYASRDDRIHYYRNDQNMGPMWNFNRLFELSSGPFFMWACHDDYWDPSYIRSCLDGFKKSEDIILVGTICKSIFYESGDTYLIDEGLSTTGLRPQERFVKYKSVLYTGRHVGGIFYGLYKQAALRQVMPLRNIIATDHLMLAELCFLGEFETIQKLLFVKRFGGASASLQKIATTMNIENRFLIRCPYFVREALLQKIIFSTNQLNISEKTSLSLWSINKYLKKSGRHIYKLYLYHVNPVVLLILSRVLPSWIKKLVKRVLKFRLKLVQ